MILTDQTIDAAAIVKQLRAATPWILTAELAQCHGGLEARLMLDPNMATARAEQQSLPDASLAAAAGGSGSGSPPTSAGSVRPSPRARRSFTTRSICREPVRIPAEFLRYGTV
jgi:hypothetical protein